MAKRKRKPKKEDVAFTWDVLYSKTTKAEIVAHQKRTKKFRQDDIRNLNKLVLLERKICELRILRIQGILEQYYGQAKKEKT